MSTRSKRWRWKAPEWIPLFEELERQGFGCLLISSRSLRKVAGQKTDVDDAQWIQTLHGYGLLKGSFRPQGDLVAQWTLLSDIL